MRVLVVEDDRSVRETLGLVLESYKYTVDLCESGECALTYLERQWPDALLLDLSLVGMSGEELYAKIRDRYHKVPPTVVLSAVQHGESRLRNMQGARFLAKPYTLDQLNEIILQTVGSKQAA